MDLPITTIVGAAACAAGAVFGATAQATGFCTMGAISDMVAMGDLRRFRSWLLAMAVAIAGTQGLAAAGLIDLSTAIYLTPRLGWAGAVLGGLMFGYGMTLAGGCGAKTLVRLGSGNLKSLVVFLVMGLFAYMTLRGLIAPARVSLEGATDLDLTRAGLTGQGLPALLAAATGIQAGTARAGLAILASGGLALWCFKDAAFRAARAEVTAGLVLGALVPVGWAITGLLGHDEFEPVALASFTFVGPIGESLQYLMTFTGATITFGIAAVGGVIAGSCLASLASGGWRIEAFADASDLLRHLLGAALMGVGGVMSLGCTIGQGLTGLSTLAAGSVMALAAIVAGGVLGIKSLEHGSLAGALKAALARG